MHVNIVGTDVSIREKQKGKGWSGVNGNKHKEECGWFTSEDNIFVTYEPGAR